MERVKPKFDFLNFVYGVGAAIVILGAMAKFMDWNYADEIFIIGLGTEVLVFLISSFRFTSKPNKYKWEKVFPGILDETEEDVQIYDQVGLNNEMVKRNSAYLETKLEQMEQNIDKLSDIFTQLTRSVEGMNTSIKKLEDANNGYELQMKELKRNLGSINEFYNDFNEVMVMRNKRVDSK
ncbi:MAG: gliding motility protein GldL [Bacteroidetes bacterium]|nr:MAG: gliding motility protein GldL [Bacteroidota bacterium]